MLGLQLIYLISFLWRTIDALQPEFIRNIPNLSIVEGKQAFLRCSVSNIGENKIIWTHVDSQQLISIQEHVIENKNGRISIQVVGDSHDTLFELRINNISLDDRGYYMCQIQCIETSHFCTAKSQVGYVNVVVPPKFDESVLQSDSNITVREFEDVNILCSASGNPKPSIYWKREDVYLNEHNIRGNRLHIISANRQDSGVYICVASNGVQPSISRKIHLIVQFAPMIRIVTQVQPGYIGDSVKLECQTECFPIGDHYWITPSNDHISTSIHNYANSDAQNNVLNHNLIHRKRNRFQNRLDDTSKRNLTNYRKYQVYLKKTIQYKYLFQLHINYVTHEDTGQYICVASNEIGEARSVIQLKVNERSHSRKPIKDHTAITKVKATTKAIDYDLTNDIHHTFRVHKIHKNDEDNHISNHSTQLLKAKKSSGSTVGHNLDLLIANAVFISLFLRFCNK